MLCGEELMAATINTPSNFTHLSPDVCQKIVLYLEPIEITQDFQYAFSAIRSVSHFWHTIYWNQIKTAEGIRQWLFLSPKDAIHLSKLEEQSRHMQYIGHRVIAFITQALETKGKPRTYAHFIISVYRELCREILERRNLELELSNLRSTALDCAPPYGYRTLQGRLDAVTSDLISTYSIALDFHGATIMPRRTPQIFLTR